MLMLLIGNDGNSLLNSVTNSNHSCSFRKPGFLICSLLFFLFSFFYTNDSFTHQCIGTLRRKRSNVYLERTQLHCTVASSIWSWSPLLFSSFRSFTQITHSLFTLQVLSLKNVVTYILSVHNYTALWYQASSIEASSVCFRSPRKTDKE